MTLRALALALLALASPLNAASWATRDVCDIDTLEIPKGWTTEQDIAEAKERAKSIPNGTGRLWRIEGPGGAVSHLFGTLHSNDPLLLDLPEELESALESARLVATEIDFRLPSRRLYRNDPSETYRWRGARANGADPPFEAELHSWTRLYFVGLGFKTPWAVLTDVGVADLLLADPCNDFNTGVFPIMDNLIALEGVLSGAEFIGLEPPITFFEELSRPERSDELYGLLQIYGAYTQPAVDNRARQATMTLYAQGHIGEMMAHDAIYLEGVFGPERATRFREDGNRYLLEDRNLAWIEKIEAELGLGGVVMAVGAFHLPGETGLVSLLRKRGFTLTRIVAEGEVLR
ncbi:MAG: TraB/GumN family protein [Pseudomonadota bacterium]